MSRIVDCFKKKKPFIGYLTAGDGDSERLFLQLVQGGVDLLEVGIPFSDPVADGPTIQKAMQRAEGTAIADVLALIRSLRLKTEAPMVLFTYFNPIQHRLNQFLSDAKQAGADGILVVDLPVEEAKEYARLCRRYHLDPIFVIAPSTSKKRMEEICKLASGFLYYACRKGTTGAREGLPSDLVEKIEQIRHVSSLPIAVGFGIADRKTADAVLAVADGFVVGSYLVEDAKRVYDFRI